MKIYSVNDGIFKEKKNKTKVIYYMFDEYEIHLNKIPPNTIQEWHFHSTIEEVILVISGTILFKWKTSNGINMQKIKANELIRVEDSVHTIENSSGTEATLVVFKTVLTRNKKSSLFKTDKTICE